MKDLKFKITDEMINIIIEVLMINEINKYKKLMDTIK